MDQIYNPANYAAIGAIIIIISGCFYKASRLIKNDRYEDLLRKKSFGLKDQYLIVPYENVSRVDFK